jgi:hypothetical protein
MARADRQGIVLAQPVGGRGIVLYCCRTRSAVGLEVCSSSILSAGSATVVAASLAGGTASAAAWLVRKL